MQKLHHVEQNHWKFKFPLCFVSNFQREAIHESNDPVFDPYKPLCVNCVAFVGAFRLLEGFEAVPEPEDFR